MCNQKFEGGTKVKDGITGYVGRITGYAEYYDGNASQYYVEGIDDMGKPIGIWLTEDRLAEVTEDEP